MRAKLALVVAAAFIGLPASAAELAPQPSFIDATPLEESTGRVPYAAHGAFPQPSFIDTTPAGESVERVEYAAHGAFPQPSFMDEPAGASDTRVMTARPKPRSKVAEAPEPSFLDD